MNTHVRKLVAGGLVAVALAGTVVAASTPASAERRFIPGRGLGGQHHAGFGGPHRGGFGGAVGFGILGGLAAGIIAGAAAAPHYDTPYPYEPTYAPDAYAPDAYAPAPPCYVAQQPVYDQWGQFAGYGPVQVCD